MLARLAALLFLLPAAALAADQPQSPSPAFRPPPAAAEPSPSIAPAKPGTPPSAPPAALAAAAVDPSECRLGCARQNYLCAAGEHPENCGGAWGQCSAACALPDLAPPGAAGSQSLK